VAGGSRHLPTPPLPFKKIGFEENKMHKINNKN
jgi:hypothetical protein